MGDCVPEGAVGRGDGMMVLKNGCYGGVVLVNSLHPEYEAHQDWWRTQREVMAGGSCGHCLFTGSPVY